MAHTHSVYDSDTHFSINPVTRQIKNESGKVTLIQHDHNSERFTFEIPRKVEEHDMSLCNKVEVHYINIDSSTKESHSDIYEVADLQISPESDDVVIGSWLVSGNATRLVGSLNFVIRFSCVAEDGTVEYAWNTAVHSGISVSTGIYNSHVVYEENYDILAQWEAQINTLLENGGLKADQNYNPESENAQSGVAVSQALKTLKTSEGTVVSQNADFAEVAEWADGNPNNEDRTGYFVCANVPVDGIVMRKATSLDDVKGVSILAPAFAGNYTKDKTDGNGNLLPKYSYVAIIGFVPVIDNGTCVVGGRCMPDDNGCAVPSSNSMGYQVVNRIDENRVLIIIEPNGDMVQRIKTKIVGMQDDINNRASAIKNTLRGETLTAKDVSPIEHNLKVSVSGVTNLSGVKVSRYGKNLLKFAINPSNYAKYENGVLQVPTVAGNSLACDSAYIYLPTNVKLCYKHTAINGDRVIIRCFDKDGNNISQTSNIGWGNYLEYYRGYWGSGANGFVFTLPKEVAYIQLAFVGLTPAEGAEYCYYSNFQIEVGTTPTAYEPYKEPQTATSDKDGTVNGLTSISPNMTLLTDTSGAVINLEYNADTKMYIDNKFAEISAAILNS